MRFSLILIFHNQRDFVRAAMDSALGQGVDGIEVIAVDDGSTDGTREVLSEYGDRARLILCDENQGTCAARNAGTEAATGDYLAYLDGDDAFMPWAIQAYRRVAERQTPAVMMGPMHWFEGALPEPGPIPESVSYVRYDDYFAKERVVDISASAIVISRRALEAVDGWDGFPVDDLHLLYRLGTAGPFVQLTEPYTTLHRRHAGQIIRQTGKLVEAADWLVANDKDGRYPGGAARRRDRRASIGGIVLHWGRTHARAGARADALRFVLGHGGYVLAALTLRAQRDLRGRRAPQTDALWGAGLS